jgi:hypothetical protein
MPLSLLFGIPFAGSFGLQFIHLSPLLASPSLPLIVAMLAVLAVMGLSARNALNY